MLNPSGLGLHEECYFSPVVHVRLKHDPLIVRAHVRPQNNIAAFLKFCFTKQVLLYLSKKQTKNAPKLGSITIAKWAFTEHQKELEANQ